jgi:hypothetical protein
LTYWHIPESKGLLFKEKEKITTVTGLLNGLAMMELNVTQQKYSFPKPLNHLTANLAYT